MTGSPSCTFDFAGLKCPLPLVELNRLIRDVALGETFVAIADDPAFCLDVEAWCRRTGQELVHLQQEEVRCVAEIRRLR